MTSLGVKQFRHEGCLSYIVFDRTSRQAVLIDPNLESLDDYRSYLADHALKAVYALDTHIHADHYSGTHLVRAEFGADIAMGEATRSARATLKLKDGQELPLGATLKIRALATPGHTPDSIIFLVGSLLFTGDTLLIGGSGRTDFPGADPALQYRALYDVIAKLPSDTVIFPGHDYNDLLFSTVGTEREKNPHLKFATREEFVRFKNEEAAQMGTPGKLSPEIQKRVDFNAAANPVTPAGAAGVGAATACGMPSSEKVSIAAISVEKYAQKLKEHAAGTGFVDVREEEEFAEGHMPGARNVPLSELALHVGELKGMKRVYFSCLSGGRSGLATKTFGYVGHGDVVNVSGGFKAWTGAGLPVTSK